MARGGDERQRAAVGEDGALRAGDVDGRIGMDIHVVEVFGRGILEKTAAKEGQSGGRSW